MKIKIERYGLPDITFDEVADGIDYLINNDGDNAAYPIDTISLALSKLLAHLLEKDIININDLKQITGVPYRNIELITQQEHKNERL